jgi:hypothetical protein
MGPDAGSVRGLSDWGLDMLSYPTFVKLVHPILQHYLKVTHYNNAMVCLNFYPLGTRQPVPSSSGPLQEDRYFTCLLGHDILALPSRFPYDIVLDSILLYIGESWEQQQEAVFSLAEDLAGRFLCNVPDAPILPPVLMVDWFLDHDMPKEAEKIRWFFGVQFAAGH